MHELELDAEVVQTFMNILRQLDPECLVKAGDVAHDMGLREDVIIAKKSFIRRAIECNDIGKHPTVLRLEVTNLPIDAFGGDQLFDVVELFLHQRNLLNCPITTHAVQRHSQTFQRCAPILHKFTALEVIEKLFILWIQEAP